MGIETVLIANMNFLSNIPFPYHLKSIARTGNPDPNMSTTFIGKSSPLDDVCRLTPTSPLANSNNPKKLNLFWQKWYQYDNYDSSLINTQ